MKSLNSYIPVSIASQLAQLQKLNRTLYEVIPIEFVGHSQIINIPANGMLHIQVDSPAWASKLRFYQQTIVKGMSANTGLFIKSVQISVNPERMNTTPTSTSGQKPYFSQYSAKLLTTLANSTEDPELKRSLLALAKRLPIEK